ncbi:hypothetical protein CKM354_001056700 [Cercospora kikuchii]|uniref:Uncharacterized protein n=1 Tax=Cercospora kikuchii TaxID=84275 RepID=A0A9P3FJT4_9PEZI|nr:uncharacterized protein CKM354_001056700 [Cercospora kikuchii]GIZ47477.1 hypothetical protein CKM354_001056700 [Cercospora kikuchii]
MADDAFAPIAGFLTSLLDPKPPKTKKDDAEPTTRTRRSRTQTEPESTLSSVATAPTPAESSTSTVVVVTSISAVAPSVTSTTDPTTSLEQPSSTTSLPATTTASVPTAAISAIVPSPNSVNTGAIAGGVVGGLAVLAILTMGLVWLLRRPRKTTNEKAVGKDEYQGSVVSLVAYGKDVPESRRSDSIWDSRPDSPPRAIPPAHLPAPPLIYVTDECDTRQLLCELPGSEPVAEMESAQKYHAYRPKPS